MRAAPKTGFHYKRKGLPCGSPISAIGKSLSCSTFDGVDELRDESEWTTATLSAFLTAAFATFLTGGSSALDDFTYYSSCCCYCHNL